MKQDLEAILSLLEQVTTALAATLQQPDETSDLERSARLLAERGRLLQEFLSAQPGQAGLSYEHFNRLLVVHVQGSQAVSEFHAMRERLTEQVLDLQRQRAYAGCLHGLINSTNQNHLETA